MGDTTSAARGCAGFQEVLADEIANEAEALQKINRRANEGVLVQTG
jgi:hypothetical protein